MTETPETEPLTTAPGQILKRAREVRNLTVAAIATQMRLDLKTIEALERGEMDKLPAPTFVRGYLRGYARLVGVSEDVVLEAYQAQSPQEAQPRAVGLSKVPVRPAFRASTIPWRGLFLAIIVLVVAWLGVQWGPQLIARLFGDSEQETAVVTEQIPELPTTDTAPIGGEPVDTAPSAPETVPSPGPEVVPTEPSKPETPQMPATQAPASESGTVALPLPAPTQAPVAETAPPATEPEPELPSDTDFGTADAAGATNAENVAAPEQTAPPTAGEVRVELTINDDSWVEVLGADGSKLVLDLLHKGDTRTVTGKAPISVLLGNAAGVEIRVDGKDFDHRRYDRDNIARFKVDGNR